MDLWKDDHDPQSLSLLRVRVLCTPAFWLCSLRCFVRVNGVRARVLDTRYLCEGNCEGGNEVLRERSWREGSWEALVGKGHTYRGKQTRTRSGYTCQRWDAQSPHSTIDSACFDVRARGR